MSASQSSERLETQLRAAEPGLARLIRRIPLQESPPLAPDWLRCEMLERYQVLRHARPAAGAKVLEVGSGPHAIATVPLAFEVGASGRVIASERSRWGRFAEIVGAAGVAARVSAVRCDAQRLPLEGDAADLAVCVHGVRSLESGENMVRVFDEMLRVAPRLFVAESLPVGRTEAQRAHLAMYDLREAVFGATMGRPDDLHYLPLEQLTSLIHRAGGRVLRSTVVSVDLPHALAYFPRRLIERVPDEHAREELLIRWDDANSLRLRVGEDHPPVGAVLAERMSN